MAIDVPEPRARVDRVRSLVGAIASAGLACLAIAACGSGPRSDVPPAGLTAFVNSSAPANDLSAGQFCSGVLVSPTTVLTARHCVVGRDADDVDVQVGARNLCSTGAIEGERIPVERMSISASSADVAIVVLAHAATTTPVSLRGSLDTGGDLIAWGWGTASEGGVPPCTATAKGLKTVPSAQCELPADADPRDAVGNYFCAVPRTGPNTCHGDSGGPVVSAQGDRWALVGITASGRGCGPGDPGLYVTDVTLRLVLGQAP